MRNYVLLPSNTRAISVEHWPRNKCIGVIQIQFGVVSKGCASFLVERNNIMIIIEVPTFVRNQAWRVPILSLIPSIMEGRGNR